MEPKKLLEFANIAALTYQPPAKSKSKFKDIGYNIVQYFEKNNAEAYLLHNGEHHVLSFRGTEVNQASDVLADFKAGKNLEKSGGKVHYGFKHELDKLWSDIEQALEGIEGELYVTGHSLGAAMATIATSRLQPRVVALVTFGSPRVGTKAFVKSVKVKHYRVQNNNDVVTSVPFYAMGFRHHGTNTYLNYYGKLRRLGYWQRTKDMLRSHVRAIIDRKFFKGIFDHFMESYISKLEKL